MSKQKKRKKEHYLKIPNHILNIPNIGIPSKLLLAHLYSFGRKGCWQSNKTLAEMFFVKERTIQRWLTELKKANLILWVYPKGRYRTIWAKSHPNVSSQKTLLYMNEEISKKDIIKGKFEQKGMTKLTPLPRQNCHPYYDKNGILLRQICHPTNNTTIKETTKENAMPAPSPAGQASALLTDRKDISRFLKKIGRVYTPMTEQQFNDRKQEQIRALQAAVG